MYKYLQINNLLCIFPSQLFKIFIVHFHTLDNSSISFTVSKKKRFLCLTNLDELRTL